MLIKINPNRLDIKIGSFSKVEAETIDDYLEPVKQLYPEQLRITDTDEEIQLSGDPAKLFNTLYMLSLKYDIEIM